MSHNHHNNNYTNYSKPQTASVVEPEVIEEVVAPVVEETVVNTVMQADGVTPAHPVPETDPVTEDSEPDGILGVVTECAKLNVRKEPSTEADVVTTLLIGTEVMVDIFESTEEFYKVTTGAGVEGYCMKKFINID